MAKINLREELDKARARARFAEHVEMSDVAQLLYKWACDELETLRMRAAGAKDITPFQSGRYIERQTVFEELKAKILNEINKGDLAKKTIVELQKQEQKELDDKAKQQLLDEEVSKLQQWREEK